MDGDRPCALVAVLDADPERLVAVGRYVCLAADPTTAEIAIVVGDDFQGWASAAAWACCSPTARTRGVRRFMALMLSDNLAARRLFFIISRRMSTQHDHAGVDRVIGDLAA